MKRYSRLITKIIEQKFKFEGFQNIVEMRVSKKKSKAPSKAPSNREDKYYTPSSVNNSADNCRHLF